MRPPRRPVAFTLSCWLGAVGVVLLVAGALTAVEGLFVAGAAAGALSLGAALYWRSELVNAWAARKRGEPADVRPAPAEGERRSSG